MRTYSALFLAPLLLAQAPRNLTGNITDYNGAVIPGARVTATPATGTSSSASTDSEGLYRLNLTPGTYTVKIESPGFKTVESRVTVPSDRTGYFDSILEPAPLTEDIIVVTTTDSASSRPAYLVGSELAQGTIFTAYGKFPERGNFRARITDSSKALRELPLFYRSPSQLAGYVPSETAAGSGIVELLPDIGPISRLPIRIVDSRPTFFTLDQSGSGGGIFTDTNFAVISRANPARPGGFYTAWVNNAGKVDNDTAPTIRNRFFADYDFRVNNQSLANSEVFYFGPSGIRGLDQMNFRVPPDFTGFGCGVPVQVGVKTEADKPFVWSNEVTIPVAASGACGDRFGFAAEDRAALAGAGIGNMEVAIGEVTIVTSNTAQAHRTTGRLTGYLWTDNVYRPVPDESCDYRWQPRGSRPLARAAVRIRRHDDDDGAVGAVRLIADFKRRAILADLRGSGELYHGELQCELRARLHGGWPGVQPAVERAVVHASSGTGEGVCRRADRECTAGAEVPGLGAVFARDRA